MPHSLRLNASLLAAIDDLSLLARTVVEGFLDGLHRSPFLGYSTEFSAYRAYTQGDNLRYIDWKVWGRTDEFYVKQFEDDTNLRGQIFLDTSASMDFGAGDANKFDYARILAAVLAELMARQHDAPGLIVFGEQARQAVPAHAERQGRIAGSLPARGSRILVGRAAHRPVGKLCSEPKERRQRIGHGDAQHLQQEVHASAALRRDAIATDRITTAISTSTISLGTRKFTTRPPCDSVPNSSAAGMIHSG